MNARDIFLSQVTLVLMLCLVVSCCPARASDGSPAGKQAGEQVVTDVMIETARKNADANPADPKVRFAYADLLRRQGKTRQASRQYLRATEVDASFYIAYHMIAQICDDTKILADATRRLNFLKETKPDELMLRVALSELLEKQGDYFRASKPLVDLLFANKVPEKYKKKVSTRIRFLQARARNKQARRKAGYADAASIKKSDLPIPTETLKRGLAASRVEAETRGSDLGHSRLSH